MKHIRSILFIIAALFFCIWIAGTFFMQTGTYIHILVMISAIVFMQGLMICPKTPRAVNQPG
jgi:hypothetical protein